MPFDWRRNLVAVTVATFLGFTGFTLVMPFLPLYFRELGLTDFGAIAIWSGVSLGVTPGITALMSPAWGRLADRIGRKVMVERSLLSFVLVMTATAFVSAPWHILALRTIQGFFAGYGALSVAMAAESAPPGRLAQAIGIVQTAQRLGPALGPIFGGLAVEWVGIRNCFFAAAVFYLVGFGLVLWLYDERPRTRRTSESTMPTLRPIDAVRLRGMPAMLLVIFAVQLIDRSFGPILPLYLEEVGVAQARIPRAVGLMFSGAALAGAVGNLLCARVLRAFSPSRVIGLSAALASFASLIFVTQTTVAVLAAASVVFGFGIGLALTATFSVAGAAIPPESRATGFGVLTSASLVGMATSPVLSGLLGAVSMRAVFVVDAMVLAGLAVIAIRLVQASGGSLPDVAGLRADG